MERKSVVDFGTAEHCALSVMMMSLIVSTWRVCSVSMTFTVVMRLVFLKKEHLL